MTLKKYLRECRFQQNQINSLCNEQEQMLNVLQSTSINPNPVQESASNPGDRIFRIVEKRNAIQEKIELKWDELLEKQEAISEAIEQMDANDNNLVYGIIIRERYINAATWDEIAKQLAYSLPHVYRLHGEALKELEKYFEAKLKDDSK